MLSDSNRTKNYFQYINYYATLPKTGKNISAAYFIDIQLDNHFINLIKNIISLLHSITVVQFDTFLFLVPLLIKKQPIENFILYDGV